VNPVLRHILETRQIKTPSGETLPLHSHIPRDEGEGLQQQYVAVVKEAKDTWINEGEKGKEGQRTFTFHREF